MLSPHAPKKGRGRLKKNIKGGFIMVAWPNASIILRFIKLLYIIKQRKRYFSLLRAGYYSFN